MAKKQKFKHLLVRYGERDLGEMEPLIALLARQDGVGYGRRNEVYVRALTLGFRAMLAEVLPQANPQGHSLDKASLPAAAPVPLDVSLYANAAKTGQIAPDQATKAPAPIASTVFREPDLVSPMPPKPDKTPTPKSPEIEAAEAPEPRPEVLVPLYRERKSAVPSPFGQYGRGAAAPAPALPTERPADRSGSGLSAAFLASVRMFGPESDDKNNSTID